VRKTNHKKVKDNSGALIFKFQDKTVERKITKKSRKFPRIEVHKLPV
jgi:hypothetical protein